MKDTASTPDPTDNEETASPVETDVAPAESDATPAKEQSTEAQSEAAPELTLEEQLEQARKEAAEAKEAHLRSVADLENFRRRMAREKDDLRAYAAANVVEELMPVLDNLGFALAAAQAENAELKALADGVEMVTNQFKTALGNHGLKEINPANEAFDPNLHEALSQQPSDEVDEGTVMQVVRIGYALNGRLLRPASVIVSGGPAADDKEAKSDD